MKGNPSTELQLATGGKELDLCVWDGNNLSKPTFQAKNVSLGAALHQTRNVGCYHCMDACCQLAGLVLHCSARSPFIRCVLTVCNFVYQFGYPRSVLCQRWNPLHWLP